MVVLRLDLRCFAWSVTTLAPDLFGGLVGVLVLLLSSHSFPLSAWPLPSRFSRRAAFPLPVYCESSAFCMFASRFRGGRGDSDSSVSYSRISSISVASFARSAGILDGRTSSIAAAKSCFVPPEPDRRYLLCVSCDGHAAILVVVLEVDLNYLHLWLSMMLCPSTM